MRRARYIRSSLGPLLLALLATASGPLPAAEAGTPDTDELLAQERLRAAVDELLEEYFQPVDDGDVRVDLAIRTVQRFVALGPDVLPYLVNELEQESQGTYDLCCYALGMLGTPAAKEALRAAFARAQEIPGNRGRSLAAWAAWGLGLTGEAEAARLLVEGRHHAANLAVHGLTSALEAVAIQTAPASVPLLLEMLDNHVDDEADWQVRDEILHALRRVGDPSAAPRVAALLKSHPDRNARREAAHTLHTLAAPESFPALVAALSDEDFSVRRVAATALESFPTSGLRELLLERLAQEADLPTRGALYRLLAQTGGAGTLERLAARVEVEDGRGRRFLAEAAALIDDPGRVRFLAELLGNADAGTALQAAMSLGDLADAEAARALIDALPSVQPLAASAIADQLVRLGAVAGGPAVATRLLHELRMPPPLDRNAEVAIEKMAGAIVQLGHGAVARELTTWLETGASSLEPGLRSALEQAAAQLEQIRTRGRKTERWLELAAAAEPWLRRVAFAQLGQIGTAEAVRGLAQSFATAERPDRIAILKALGSVPAPRARALLERVLLEETFDHPHEAELRDMAGWSARRIGGEAMWELLSAAARRREGRDAKVLIYAALIGGPRAQPLLAELRRPRMRYLGWNRGREQERLDWLAERLALGRSARKIDLPPEMLSFQ